MINIYFKILPEDVKLKEKLCKLAEINQHKLRHLL